MEPRRLVYLRKAPWFHVKVKLFLKILVLVLSVCIFTTAARIDNWKNMLSNNISSTCPHNMVNFGPLAAETDWRIRGTPANFNGFRILPSLLQRRQSTEANQTLHDVWLSPGLIDYLYIFGGCCLVTEFCQMRNLSPPSLALSYIAVSYTHLTLPTILRV